jgi:enolase
MLIKEISAKPILDSRGKKTIQVSINGCNASSPSGKSTGKYETPCWHKNLEWNIKSINNLKINFQINSFEDLSNVEKLIKKNFKFKDVKQFGGNALFALESAILKALAKSKNKELWEIINNKSKVFPSPLGNAIGGGLHSESFSSPPTFQEFLLAPKGKSFKEKVKVMNKIYTSLGRLLKTKSINDEGAWQTSLNEEKVMEILLTFKNESDFGLDIAASSFYTKDSYYYKSRNITLSRDAQILFVNSIVKKFSPLYIEDPLQEEDFSGFAKIKKKKLISGDDLTVTHLDRVKKAIKNQSMNSMIIKPNQNGSLIEVAKIFDICKKNKIKTIISHRSGETLDDSLADYAFGFGADYIKCGIATKWRQAKLNRLLEIEKNMK